MTDTPLTSVTTPHLYPPSLLIFLSSTITETKKNEEQKAVYRSSQILVGLGLHFFKQLPKDI